MSEDPDFDMEVVEEDELDELGADGTSSSEERIPSETDEDEEGTAESAGYEMEVVEVDDADSVTTRSDSRREDGERGRTTNSTSKADSGQEIFGLGSVPDEWEDSSLPSVVEIEMGSSPPSSTYNEEGQGLPFYQGNTDFGHMTPKVSTWCSDPVKTADKGDVLISIRAPVGDLNIADEHCCIGRGLAALRPDEVNGLYLFYGLAQRSRWLSRLASGSTFKSVSSADLEKVDLPVPPLPEQRKIASILYAVDQAIQKMEAIIEQAKRVKRGLMQKLFREGLHAGPQKEIRRIGQIPSEWEVVRLGEVSDRITDGTHQSPETKEEGFPYITSQNIRDWGFDLSDMKYISKEAHEKITSRCSPQKGDVLYVKDGANTGTVQVNTLDFEFSLLSSVALIRTTTDVLDPLYLKHLLSWPKFRQLMMSRMSGTGISRLTISKIEKSEILLPPIEEQQRISDILNTFDDTVTKEDRRLTNLRRLKKGLMQDLLTGEVRTADKAIEVLDEVKTHG